MNSYPEFMLKGIGLPRVPPAFSETDQMWIFAAPFSEAAADTKARSTLPQVFREYRFHEGTAAALVGTAQQVLGHNPFEILVLALDAVSGTPVRP